MATDPTGRLSHLPDMHRGVSWKQPCRVATTASVTISSALNAGDTIDGVTLAAGDRVLVKDQGTVSQNGIYVAGATPVRAFDMDQDGSTTVTTEEVAGAYVHVLAGTANAGTLWRTTNVAGATLGSTSIVWQQFANLDGDQYVTRTLGGQETVDTIAVSGATRTVDLADGNVADLTLSEACALTLDGFVNGVSSSGVVIVRPSGYSLTFTDDIAWLNGVVPTLSTTEDYALVFWSFDGGTTIGGTLVNSASAVTGRWEVVVSGSAPPVAVSTPSDDDWVYAWVED